MIIKKDNFHLDKKFPFSYSDSLLTPFYNMGKVYHWHDCLEISYVKEGKGRYYIEDKVFEMRPGDIIIINNIEPHYLEVYEEGMYQPVIIFDPSLVWSHSSHSMDYDYLKPFFERGTDFNNKLNLSNPITTEIMKNLIEIETEYKSKHEGYQLMIKARLLVILSNLIRHFRDSSKSDFNSNNKRLYLTRLEDVFKYTNENFDKDIKLTDVASIIFVTPQYFSSFFKKVMGVTFIDYLNNIRINHAIKLLNQTDKKITHIAMECGFNNTSNFNNAFKKFTGKTPSQFR